MVSLTMRPSCLMCARKHLGQAEVLMSEALKGYPQHAWLAIGHLAEAEDELLEKYPEIAATVREHRLIYMGRTGTIQPYDLPTMTILAQIEAIPPAAPLMPPSLFTPEPG